jgi:ABC-type multidrug transport system fused ATPase/permease subunit
LTRLSPSLPSTVAQLLLRFYDPGQGRVLLDRHDIRDLPLRITIARAILRDAPVLILDEPTTGLDPGSALRLLGSLREATAGRTTILITHDLNLASVADDVMSLDGKRAPRPAASEPCHRLGPS